MIRRISGSDPTGNYSPGIVVSGPLVFVSGQGAELDGAVVGDTIAEQTRLTLAKVEQVLAAAGASRSDVVRCTVYLADMADFAAMDGEFGAFFGTDLPTRTTIGGVDLGGLLVEIDAIAALPV